MNTSHEIIIACDTPEAAEFAAWLNEHGHSADVGNSTGNYVDGCWTASDGNANEILSRLWNDYCSRSTP